MSTSSTSALFRDYQKVLGETCLHNHGKRKSKKKKKASSSESESEQEAEKRKSRKRSKKESDSRESDSDSDYHKKKKKKKKKAKAKSVSESRLPDASDEKTFSSKKSRKKIGMPSLSPSPTHSVSPQGSRRGGGGREEQEGKRRPRSAIDESIEEGELSSDELERKRMQLLKQLQEDD